MFNGLWVAGIIGVLVIISAVCDVVLSKLWLLELVFCVAVVTSVLVVISAV